MVVENNQLNLHFKIQDQEKKVKEEIIDYIFLLINNAFWLIVLKVLISFTGTASLMSL
jgi:hypothetical protein